MANLLIQTTPHQVLPELAAEIGINEALLLQQLHFLITHNNCYEYQGRFWYCHTVEQWIEKFPYFSEKTFRRTASNLHKLQLVDKQKLHWKVLGIRGNSTMWYAINYEKVNEISTPIQREIISKKVEKARQNQARARVLYRTGQSDQPSIGQSDQPSIGQSDQLLYKIKKEIEEREITTTKEDAPKVAETLDKTAMFSTFIQKTLQSQHLTPEMYDKLRAKSDLFDTTSNPSESGYYQWMAKGLELINRDLSSIEAGGQQLATGNHSEEKAGLISKEDSTGSDANLSPSRAAKKKPKAKPLSHLQTYPEGLNVDCWLSYLQYKKEEHRGSYKTERSETTAINKLIRESGGDQQVQALAVESSIANGWKGLFPEKVTRENKHRTTKEKLLDTSWSDDDYFDTLDDDEPVSNTAHF